MRKGKGGGGGGRAGSGDRSQGEPARRDTAELRAGGSAETPPRNGLPRRDRPDERSRAEGGEKAGATPGLPRRAELALNLAFFLLPLLLLLVFEGALRLAGYGYPTGFFVHIPGREGWTPNQKYGWRFFPKGDARTPVPAILPDGKPEGTLRLFVLGESAAMGDPVPAFGFSRILEVMLEARHPAHDFEVINTGMTAINSHVVLPIAADCSSRNPDLFVVYMGNNEVVGPFGAGTVLDAYRSSRAMIRAGIALRAARTGQLVESLVENLLPGTGAAPEWRGMETFLGNAVGADDPRMEGVYDHFEANLRGILDVARRAGAGVVVSTIAVNLRDHPPFASVHRGGMSDAERGRWDVLFGEGVSLERSGQLDTAAARYEEALRIDDSHAELHYRFARCLEESGRHPEAKAHYQRSRDLDALRFRADSRVNEIIRQVAGGEGGKASHSMKYSLTPAEPGARPAGAIEDAGTARFHLARREGALEASPGALANSGVEVRTGLFLVDAERAFEASPLSPHGVPGEDLLFDHVHFTFEGNYLLARTVLEGVEALLPPEMSERAAGAVPTLEEVAAALTLTAWNRHYFEAQALRIVERPPFTAQADHGGRVARWRERERDLAATAGSIGAAAQAHLSALERKPGDLLLRESFAKLLRAAGDGAGSAEQWQDLLARIPESVVWLEELGHVLLSTGRHAEAEAAYREALEVWPGRALTHGNLALALEQEGKAGDALEEYREALRLDPALIAPRLNLAQALSEQGRKDEALAEMREAVRRDPEHLAARLSLAGALAEADRAEEAIGHYRAAIGLRPDLADARLRLAKLMHSSGRAGEASTLLEEAARADPGSVEARLGLASISRAARRYDEAIGHYREALRLSPGFPPALNGLAWMLATAEEPRHRNGAEALSLANELCARTGCRTPIFAATFAAACAQSGQFERAVEAARQAIALARSAGDERAAREIEGHLARYEAGKAL